MTTLSPGDPLPGVYRPDSPCMAVRPGYETLPPRCARMQGHEGFHASGSITVFEVWS